MNEPDDRDHFEQLSRQEQEGPWLDEEDNRILAMATERFDKAFNMIFGGNNDTAS